MDDLPEGSPVHNIQSFVGIVVAIVGNIIISLALNCQKLAHRRLEADSTPPQLNRASSSTSNKPAARHNASSDARGHRPRETTPLKPLRSPFAKYSSAVSSRFKLSRKYSQPGYSAVPTSSDDVEDVNIPQSRVLGVVDMTSSASQGDDYSIQEEEDDGPGDLSSGSDSPPEVSTPPKTESAYLRSKLWCVPNWSCGLFGLNSIYRWLGFILMNVGEMGNFLSYAYAPYAVAYMSTMLKVAHLRFVY